MLSDGSHEYSARGVRAAAGLIEQRPEEVDVDTFTRALGEVRAQADDSAEWSEALDALDDAVRAVAEENDADIARLMGGEE